MSKTLGQDDISSLLIDLEELAGCSPITPKIAKLTVFDEKNKKSFSVSSQNIPKDARVLFASTTTRKRGDASHHVQVIGIGENATLRDTALQVNVPKNSTILPHPESVATRLTSRAGKPGKSTAKEKSRRGRKQIATKAACHQENVEEEAARLAFSFPDEDESFVETVETISDDPLTTVAASSTIKCTCPCTCGAAKQQSNDSRKLAITHTEDKEIGPELKLRWLICDKSGEWFYPGAPSMIIKLPGRVFHISIHILVTTARKLNIIPKDSKLNKQTKEVESAFQKTRVISNKDLSDQEKAFINPRSHPYTAAMKYIFRQHFSDQYIKMHSLSGKGTNNSCKVALSDDDTNFCFTIKNFLQAFRSYSQIPCEDDDIDPFRVFRKLSTYLSYEDKRKVKRKISLPSPSVQLRTSPRRTSTLKIPHTVLRTSPRRKSVLRSPNTATTGIKEDSPQIIIAISPLRSQAIEKENTRSNTVNCKKALFDTRE